MKKKNLLALLLSLMMATSTTAAFTSCGDDDATSSSSSSSSSTETTDTEELTILNADFETYDDNDGKNPMVTEKNVDGWTWSKNTASSGTAIESKSASGIIDTQDKAWDELTTSGLPEGKTAASLTEKEAEQYWDDMTAKDKVEFYQAWEKANPKKDIEDELDFYEALNIDEEDLFVFKNYKGEVIDSIANPRTHDWKEGDEVEEDEYGKTDTKVLMLRNNHSSSQDDFIGTATKFTSTTNVTVDAGTCAEFSVWVKTANLRDQRNETVVDKGAYIQITHALGGKTQEPLVVKNINTAGVTDNNGWVKYTFALKASPFTSSSFTIVLGLGMTGGTNRLEYVNGVAFFDDITCKTLETYEIPTGAEIVTLDDENKVYQQNEASEQHSHYVIDFTDSLVVSPVLNDESKWNIAPTTEERSGNTYSSVAGQNPYPTLNGGFAADKDMVGIYNSVADLNDANNAFAQSAYKEHFEGKTYLTNEKALILFSARGAAYTAKSPAFNLDADEYILFSFFVKTSEMNGLTGASIKLVDNEGNPSIAALDSTVATKIEVDETDIHDGWAQCFFFIHNDSGMGINDLHFEFSYGPTTIIDTAKSAYQPGFAVFTHFQTKGMNAKEFECAVSGTQSKVVTLSGNVKEPAGDNGFGTPVLSQVTNIENGYALPTEYTGVYSDSVLVGGTSKEVNKFANAGLLDREYADNYATILNRLGGADWNAVFGDPVYSAAATRPLVIESSNQAYGFIGGAKSVSANSMAAISLRVKVSAGAVANVYLIDTSDKAFDVLNVERSITYWYDEKGNVLSLDPNDEDFSPTKHTAFNKQSNGLYKVNPTWEYAAGVDADAYFANLLAYEVDEKTGNLLLDGKTTYAYNDDWKHDGNDGYAFYSFDKTEKSAFAYSDDTVKVLDFSNVANLAPRYTAKTSGDLSVTVENTNGNWAEIIFYVKAGDSAKSYRLEVWNGYRDGTVANNSTGFVAFDAWSVDSTETTVNEWLTDATANKTEGNDYFENVFSFYDHAQYLRYDASLDLNKVGDAFESYVSATDGEGTAYYCETVENTAANGSKYTTHTAYANFSYEEKVQAADPVEDESDNDNSSNDKTDDNETNPWLLASSIIVAAVLLFVVASLIVRKVREYIRKKRGVTVAPAKRLKKEKKTK